MGLGKRRSIHSANQVTYKVKNIESTINLTIISSLPPSCIVISSVTTSHLLPKSVFSLTESIFLSVDPSLLPVSLCLSLSVSHSLSLSVSHSLLFCAKCQKSINPNLSFSLSASQTIYPNKNLPNLLRSLWLIQTTAAQLYSFHKIRNRKRPKSTKSGLHNGVTAVAVLVSVLTRPPGS